MLDNYYLTVKSIFQYFCFCNVVIIQFLSDPVPISEGGQMYPSFVRIFWGRNFYSWMPFLKPTRMTAQETGPLAASYDRMAALLFSIQQSKAICNKISSGKNSLIRRPFLWKKSKFWNRNLNGTWKWTSLFIYLCDLWENGIKNSFLVLTFFRMK